MALTGPLSMGVATARALLQVLLAMCLSACLSVCLSVCLSLCLCLLLYVDRSACSSCSPCLVLLLLPPCNVVCVGGLQPGYHAHGGRGAGSASPPYPSGALQERYARKGGGTRWWVRGRTTTSGLHACTHAPGSAPHCCGSRCTAVGSVAATCWLLASFHSFAAGVFGGGGEGGDWRLLIFDFIFSRRGCGALAFAARGATPKSFAAGGAHAPLCLLNFLGSSHTLGVVSRLA